ncbi:hypothetical protein BST27_09640 [Mycobacterium intermedium]|uniref:Uncharacterized protein n=1 Tax=Mycobacterium intermedium TaxID=28445 RepID=A0A1E3SBX6_MYCIE|nr:hypothetical protein [Mycobacterium intermedium]MCV6966891.1 hypothetical protein [Mycobacterium intermedium]ODQ99666.1 hypothetical protein BHQ20_16080 [Mycobacterium intermedium]OPE49039.1 hypothetical protein BV508_15600 [Mycobacterium intermedium]ORB07172.1 hypothetical protein BST27_09640 [Mycobacterium intermedium]
MHCPDTIIEIHRERVQDQTAGIFSGDKYTESVDGPGYSATATLDLTLDRVWFIFDSHQRLWQEETDDGELRDPLRHFAIDLVVFNSKIVIDSVSCIPLVKLPPVTITIPDGPRAGESREIAYNEIPLFGRLTLHDQLEPHETEPGRQTIALNFHKQDAPVLVAARLGEEGDKYTPRLFGPNIERRSDGSTVFTGQTPMITWELDHAEAHWITHSIAGQLMVGLERLQHPTISDEEARIRMLDSLAAQIADAVRPKMADMGDGGIVDILPETLPVDPEADDDSSFKDLDAIVHRFEVESPQETVTHESLVVQLQTLRELPAGEGLPASILAENPREKAGLAVTGFSILRQVRDTVMNNFGLNEDDFDADAPCLLNGPKTISIGGEERSLDALDADIVPRTGDGKLVIDGTVSADTTLYDFKANFKVIYEMVLDDIPRDPQGKEKARAGTLETIETLERALAVAGEKRRAGELSDEGYEAEVKRVNDRFDELPRTVGVRPTQNPPEPDVNADFNLTLAGKAATAAGATAVMSLLALPVTWAVGAGVGASAGSVLTLAIVQYFSTLLTIDWFGAGIGSRQVKKSLNDRPEGTLLPPIGIPVAVDLNRQRLAVYFRELPAKLWVSCVTAEATGDEEDGNDTGPVADHNRIRFVGGRWPNDGQPWKLSNDDAVLYVDSGELQLLVTPDNAVGSELNIGVVTDTDGQGHLHIEGEGSDALHRLPPCDNSAEESA